MSRYSEFLRDPRWQKKRLEVLNRDGWRCLVCGSGDKELHVHHLKYSGRPWESDLGDLETLCFECHDWREVWNLLFPGSSISSSAAALMMRFIQGHLAGRYLNLEDLEKIKKTISVIENDIKKEQSCTANTLKVCTTGQCTEQV